MKYQNLYKEEKEKSKNMVVTVSKISWKIKNKRLLTIEKNIIEWENSFIIIIFSNTDLNLLQKKTQKIMKKLKPYIKMDIKINEIEKHEFYNYKSLVSTQEIN